MFADFAGQNFCAICGLLAKLAKLVELQRNFHSLVIFAQLLSRQVLSGQVNLIDSFDSSSLNFETSSLMVAYFSRNFTQFYSTIPISSKNDEQQTH